MPWNSFSGNAISSLEFRNLGTHDLAATPAPASQKGVFATQGGIPSHSALNAPQAVVHGTDVIGTPSSGAPRSLQGIDASTFNVAQMKSGVMSHLDMQLAAIYQQQVAGEAAMRGPSLASVAGAGFQSAMSTNAAGKTYVTIDVTVKDLDGNGVINAADRQIIGKRVPSWTGSFSNSFRYGNVDLYIMVYTRRGEQYQSSFDATLMTPCAPTAMNGSVSESSPDNISNLLPSAARSCETRSALPPASLMPTMFLQSAARRFTVGTAISMPQRPGML